MIRTLWQASRPLTAAGLFMLPVFLLSIFGIFADSRLITGMPAWLKPAKFAISTAIYMLTMAWVFTFLPGWDTLKTAVAWITAVVMILEVAIIDFQAARGATSHFNVASPLDQALFAIMGIAIFIAWIASVALTVALFRSPAPDAMTWAVRLGMLITVLGSATGGFMVRPTQAQLDAVHAGQKMTVSGAHTVGAPDGGPGLPGTGWSTEFGDIRIPHFLGLHAIQILPLLVWLFPRLSPSAVAAAGLSYAALFAILLWQALRAQSLIAPDSLTLAALGTWLAASATGLWVTR